MSKKSRIKDDDRKLWEQVAKTTVKLTQTAPFLPPVKKVKPRPLIKTAVSPKPTPQRQAVIPKTRVTLAPSIEDELRATSLSMDKKTYSKMSSGKLSPEARLDLHGLTLAQAQPALAQFIMKHAARGARLVLVISGKGKSRDDFGPIPERKGVLREMVPRWLSSAPLHTHVLQVAQSHQKHGGAGAYYVYLKRKR